MRGPVVIGGGLAGAAVATLLARAGAAVTLVEQYAEPRHKMCGEFLSVEACESLLLMGLDLRTMGAVPVRHLRMAGGGGCVGHDLPFVAQSLTRRVLDEAMLRMASESGVEVRRGQRVEALERAAGGWQVRMSAGDPLCAEDVFLASGKHDVRGHARPDGPQGGLIAFKQYFRLAEEQRAELWGAIELILFGGGYAGMQMVEGGCANLCLLVKARRYKQMGGTWVALMAAIEKDSAQLRRRLRGAEAVLERPLSLSKIPYGYLRRDAEEAGLWYLGDQAAVIPSFSGDGMSIALHTARVAAEVYASGMGQGELSRRLDSELGGLLWRATALSRMMVSGAGQRVVRGAVRMFPSLLPRAAAVTRIPGAARARLREVVAQGESKRFANASRLTMSEEDEADKFRAVGAAVGGGGVSSAGAVAGVSAGSDSSSG